RLDERIDALAVGRGCHADLTPYSGGQAVPRQLLPGGAAVGGAIEPAARAATLEDPRLAYHLPHRRLDDARVCWLGLAGDATGLVVDVEHRLPRLTAIARAVDSALAVCAERMPQRRDQHGVGVRRIHCHPADRFRVAQADELPGLAGVGRLVDAVAGNDI